MQGTVATFDPSTRAAVVLLDDGVRVDVPPTAFDSSGLRLLRSGQRVRLDRAADGTVNRISLITM